MHTSTDIARPPLARRLGGAWALLHPGPSLVTVLAFLLFALIAAGGHPPLPKLILTTLGMACIQFAISTLNDYCDRAADRLSTKRKPIVLGLVSPQFALWLTAAFVAGMVLCYAPFGPGPFALAIFALALGVAYDLGVKRTPFSGIMLGLEFPTLPLLAWALFATVHPALYWTYLIGLALGLAIHLADALPDAVVDAQAGARGLTQVLGSHALAACWGLCASAIGLTLLLGGMGLAHARWPILLVADVIAAGLLGVAIFTNRTGASTLASRLRTNFLCVVGIAFATALGWLIAAVV
jgi:4-hydroxybenzoate polyprenyltransferase